MSIVPLSKVTLFGHRDDKEAVLDALQTMGCLHIIPLGDGQRREGTEGASSEAREALRYLLSCRRRRRQVTDPARFDAHGVETRALEIQRLVRDLEDEQDRLEERIAEVRPWGDFTLPPAQSLRGLRLWFYVVPLHEVKRIPEEAIAEVVARDHRFAYVVAIALEEPAGMPVPRTRTGKRSLYQLERRLEEVELALEDLQAERASLTRWCQLYASRLFRLEDREALLQVTGQTLDVAPLFALQAWTPSEHVPALREHGEKRGLVVEVEDPGPDDTPPTLLRNRQELQSGQDLVSFYMTPGYRLWDPSSLVFFSFSVFFAMILSDAGYALVMAAGLLLGWARMGRSETGRRFRILFAALVATSAVWGVLVGSYFGYAPPSGGILARFKVLTLDDFDGMMRLSILIGVGHLVIANLADMVRRGLRWEALVPVGWVALFLGAVSIWLGADAAAVEGMGQMLRLLGADPAALDARLTAAGEGAMIAGAVAVLLFTPAQGPFYKRLVAGVLALTKLTSAFGDALSYLRLFALGLASASLAMAFNDLADQVRSVTMPGFNLLFGMLVFLVGHTLNLALGVVSGFIHGLRLNFIEFFNWSIPEEGRPFRAFSKKEA